MRLSETPVHTLRESPANARTEGMAFLVRAQYLTKEGALLPLGEEMASRVQEHVAREGVSFFQKIGIPLLETEDAWYFAHSAGGESLLLCDSCGYAASRWDARFSLPAPSEDAPRPLRKVETPHCATIEDLAAFLEIPAEKTAKALMFTRVADGAFIFVVVRGDRQLSERKLTRLVGETRPATEDEILAAGAAPGYASPIGVKDALVVVDEMIPRSANLAAGANETGFHFVNTNYGRDYTADIVADLALAQEGDRCPECGAPLHREKADLLARTEGESVSLDVFACLHAIAETHHDDYGLILPEAVAPYDLALLWLPGRKTDTRPAADALYRDLQNAGFRVMYDDREARAGVKFNDADLLGMPIRITVGERGLNEGNVEVKRRMEKERQIVPLSEILDFLHR